MKTMMLMLGLLVSTAALAAPGSAREPARRGEVVRNAPAQRGHHGDQRRAEGRKDQRRADQRHQRVGKGRKGHCQRGLKAPFAKHQGFGGKHARR